jgi:hypothetical protein
VCQIHSSLLVTLRTAGNHPKKEYNRVETVRGVACSVFTSTYRRSKSDDPIYFEIFIPKVDIKNDIRMPFFSVSETASGVKKPDGTGKFKAVMMVDFFYIETIDKSDPHQLARLEEELSMPFGKGCSEFLTPATTSMPAYQSFMMSYVQTSTNTLVSLAYDHEFGYLRKEQHGHSVAIWDLNEGLLYHLDRSMAGTLSSIGGIGAQSSEVPLDMCSLLKFEMADSNAGGRPEAAGATGTQDSMRGTLVRPFDREGQPLDVLKFLSADSMSYLGQSIVRDLPCMVFETILDKPPKIFQVDIQEYGPYGTYDYIVLYHVFKSDKQATIPKRIERGSEMVPVLDRFWPARIELLVRHKETAWTHLHESLEVQDFHWGLYGWQGKPSELFMMPECFNNDHEQLKIELALNFKQLTPIQRQNLLARYKYKLELDLQTDLFRLLQMSRLHLTEYRLTLQRHNFLANLVISDRKEDKLLSYFGEGELPKEGAYKDDTVLLRQLTATGSLEGCVMTASHISTISMAIYCPAPGDLKATCTAVYGNSEPAIKTSSRADDSQQAIGGGNSAARATTTRGPCQVYRFQPGEPPKPATDNLNRLKFLLNEHTFTFHLNDETISNQYATFEGTQLERELSSVEVSVEDYDITREQEPIIINNYRFVVAPAEASSANGNQQQEVSNVRYFGSMHYNSLGDCMRMCNLDSGCKSFSYCRQKRQPENGDDANDDRCVLSSLDLRTNLVELQLTRTTLDENQQLTVRDEELLKRNASTQMANYKLSLQSDCLIHERDFLGMFTRTEEFLRIDATLASQYTIASSASECAHRVVDLEEKEASHHGATFAYCAHTGTCLSDEQLFGELDGVPAGSVADEDDPSKGPQQELTCQVFRKRYQTYFHVSPMVVKRVEDGSESEQGVILKGGIRQTRLQLNTVEECARVCWISLGHVCISFDYCSPGWCFINSLADPESSMGRYDPGSIEYELRTDCLAYKRDFKWDQLRRDHLLGKHTVLWADLAATPAATTATTAAAGTADKSTSHSWVWNLLLAAAILVMFDVGLIVGRDFNARWNNTSGVRRSLLSSSTRTLSRFVPASRSTTTTTTSTDAQSRPLERMSSQSRFNIENEIYEDPNAIRLDEIGANNAANRASSLAGSDDNPDQSDGGQPNGANEPNGGGPDLIAIRDGDAGGSRPKPAKRPANYIDVPDLL